jgi:GxxExxY protein
VTSVVAGFEGFITTEDTEDHRGKLRIVVIVRPEESMASPAAIRTPRVNQVSGAVVDAALKVHSLLGPGLLESAYQACLAHELRKRGLHVAAQVGLPLVYEGEKLDLGYRIDLLVENLVVVEIKCVEAIHPVHEAQLLSYLRLSGKSVGLLINFHVARLKDGIKHMVDGRDWIGRGNSLPQRSQRNTEKIKEGFPLCPSVTSVVICF